jgi:nucleotide-binding universal stress UspA family protein
VSGIRRIIVGASGSPTSLRALRYAGELARTHHAELIPVLAWVPPGGDLADRRMPSRYLRQIWEEEARQRLHQTLGAAWGGVPADIRVHPAVQRGEPHRVLVCLAATGDLLVIGTGRRGWLARAYAGRVSHYCMAHAPCPVLAVPPPLALELHCGPLGWTFWRRAVTPQRIVGNAEMQ